MKKDNIMQFVCFATNLELKEFEVIWEHFAVEFTPGKDNTVLQSAVTADRKNKYKYVSQHECKPENFRFAFMKGKNSEHFPDHTAKVIQIGGYGAVQHQGTGAKGDVKIIAFISSPETDFGFYHRQTYRHLNIYEAYFENCTYSYIMEFFVQEPEASSLISQLLTKPGVEAAVYKKCSALHVQKTMG